MDDIYPMVAIVVFLWGLMIWASIPEEEKR
jgi:hypothetical protein